ncbi:hypothetical protein QBC38DRAFT_505147 [Podospora fimiseda]|uniref:F-box domain-containing protein n=1 Tax=Podospora fimiseda TaxID=252190 RepID=A0AAN6YKV3_9PEZI|nr:hypothetical protein QBC38DRAFT_505147 [Podospora fimiseda]
MGCSVPEDWPGIDNVLKTFPSDRYYRDEDEDQRRVKFAMHELTVDLTLVKTPGRKVTRFCQVQQYQIRKVAPKQLGPFALATRHCCYTRPSINTADVAAIGRNCPTLESLRVAFSSNSSSDYDLEPLEPVLFFQGLQNVRQNLRHLEFSLGPISSFRSLGMRYKEDQRLTEDLAPLKTFTALKRLRIDFCYRESTNEDYLVNCLPPNIEELEVVKLLSLEPLVKLAEGVKTGAYPLLKRIWYTWASGAYRSGPLPHDILGAFKGTDVWLKDMATDRAGKFLADMGSNKDRRNGPKWYLEYVPRD